LRTRLVIITGSAPGAGKSTLMRTLATGLRGLGDSVIEVGEDAVWGERQLGTLPVDYATAWPEFRALLHERPSGGYPTVTEVFDTFACVQRRAATARVWIQDWSWIDLAGMLPWAGANEGALLAFSCDLQRVARSLWPLVLHLRIDPQDSLRRAVAERGGVWFDRHAGASSDDLGREERLRALAAFYSERERRRLRVLNAGGWDVVVIDAQEECASVLRRALEAVFNRTPRGLLPSDSGEAKP
jgi:hypothetical protein